MYRVLFVCTGNICRSPTADAVFRHEVQKAGLSDRIAVDSAGTIAFHVGEPPDRRARAAAKRRGIDMSDIRARQAGPQDFHDFNLILALDKSHLNELSAMKPDGEDIAEVGLFLDYAPSVPAREIVDPYYAGGEAFERVLDQVEAGAKDLLEYVRSRIDT